MNVRPFIESCQDSSAQVVELVDWLSALTAVAGLSPQGDDESSQLRTLLRILLQNGAVERAAVFLLHEQTLVNAAGIDWSDVIACPAGEQRDRRATGAIFELGEGLIGRAALTGEVQYAHNCAEDSRFAEKPDARVDNGRGSLICVPIRGGGRLLGVLSAYHSIPNRFSCTHERFFEVFAAFVGQAVINGRYVERLQADIEQRAYQLEEALRRTAHLKDRFEQLSIRDELTALHNRRFFFPEAQSLLARAIRHDHAFTAMILDLDNFKRVNDRYGHAAGDRILQIVGRLLKQQIREGDVLARFGGEEFALALPDTGLDGACLLAERILGAIRGHDWAGDGFCEGFTASVGLASQGPAEEGTTAQLLDRLLRRADEALYASKAAGRDRATVAETATPNFGAFS